MRHVAVLVALLLARPAFAQMGGTSTRPIQVVVSGGMQVPTGGFADYHELGVHADAGLSLKIGGFRFRPEVGYTRFKLKDLVTTLGGASAGAEPSTSLSTMLGGFANLELPLGHGAIQPFVLAGLGAVNLATDATAGAQSVSDLNASVNLGAGIRFRLGSIGGIIEARLNNVPSADSRAYFKDVRTIPVTFGLVF